MAGKIDWYYHRKGCRTCARADAFLEQAQLQIAEQINARKDRLGPNDAIKLARDAEELFVMRGKKLLHFDMKKDNPSDDELIRLMIGPSGNLRAPTMRRGNQLFVCFDENAFSGHLA